MKRSFWLIWTVTILFGIEAPLCAMACVGADGLQIVSVEFPSDLANPGMDSTSRESPAPKPPCHESGSDSSRPPTPDSHQDCGCDFAVEVLLSDSPAEVSTSLVGWLASDVSAEFKLARGGVASMATFASHLPPPDILLLKSTLLI